MSQLTKKSPIVEIFTKASLTSQFASEVEKSDYKDAMEHIKELASNPNPMNRYELNQIVAYVVDSTLDIRLNYLPLIADVKNTAFNERPKFKVRTQGITAYWQALGATPQKSKVGYKYADLVINELSARPIAEWAEISAGRYDFAELIRDTTNEFEAKIAKKVQDTLFATFSGLSSPNYATGSGVVASSFDPLLVAMQRLGRCSIIGDFAGVQKIASLTGFTTATSTLQFSPDIINDQNMNGFIGVYKGANVVKLDNPYTGYTGFNTVLDPGYIYVVPAVSDEMKSVKVQFAGDVVPMEGTNIEDGSYEMRFDKHMGCGVVASRYAMAVYADSSL